MARLMSVILTEDAVVARTKTVTRRTGWTFARPGDRLQLCRKVMGRRPGEPLVRLALVEVVDVCRERLDAVTAADIELEGLAPLTPGEFVTFFCGTHKHVTPESAVTRIEWRYLDPAEPEALEAAVGPPAPDGPATAAGGSVGHTAPGLLDNEEDRGQLSLFGCDEGWYGL